MTKDIEIFQTNLRKNINKNNYSLDIGDIGNNDGRFHQNDRGALISEVIVIFKDDYLQMRLDFDSEIKDLNERLQSLQNELNWRRIILQRLPD